MKKLIPIILIACLHHAEVSGQNSGDYQTRATGNWNSYTVWQQYDGSKWNNCTANSQCPGYNSGIINTKVTIRSGHTITAKYNLTGNSAGILEVAAGGTLNMGTSYTINTFGSTIISGSLTTKKEISTNSLIITGILSSSAYVNSVSFDLEPTGKFITSYNNNSGGWWSSSAPTPPVILNGEIEFASLVFIPSFVYHDITCSSGSSILSGDITVNGLLTISSGATLALQTKTIFIEGSGISLDGSLDGGSSYMTFDGGDQSITGEGTFGDYFSGVTIGETSNSNVTITNPNVLSINDLTIYSSTGSSLTLDPSAKLNIGNSLTTGDNLNLKASETEPYICASVIVSPSATVNGKTNCELYLTGGQNADNTYKWHYISSPFTNLDVDVFTSVTSNIANYQEKLVTTDRNAGWVKSSGYIYSTGLTGIGFSTLDPGYGYDHYYSSPHKYVLTGELNNNTVSSTLTYNSAGSTPDHLFDQGYNLIGNPFSSCLDWDQIDDYLPTGVGWGIYFTTGDGKFASWINGVGSGGTSSVQASGIIPPMQGFFVKTLIATSIELLESARVNVEPGSEQGRYKKGLVPIPLVRLKLESSTSSDDAVIRFDTKATTGVDNAFDAYKFSKTGGAVNIWTSSGSGDFSINGLPFPEPNTFLEIPVSINSKSSGTVKISGTEINELSDYSVTLTDKLNNYTVDLKTTPFLSFNAPAGTVSGRFVLKIGNIATGIADENINPVNFNVFSSFGYLNIQAFSDKWIGKTGQVSIYDLSGRLLTQQSNIQFSRESLVQIPMKSENGIYIVEIKSGVLRYANKVVINRY